MWPIPKGEEESPAQGRQGKGREMTRHYRTKQQARSAEAWHDRQANPRSTQEAAHEEDCCRYPPEGNTSDTTTTASYTSSCSGGALSSGIHCSAEGFSKPRGSAVILQKMRIELPAQALCEDKEHANGGIEDEGKSSGIGTYEGLTFGIGITGCGRHSYLG